MIPQHLFVKSNLVAAVIVLIGLLQIFGYVSGNRRLSALGVLSGASPLPLVFNAVNGVEYWAAEYEIEAQTQSGRTFKRTMTPELFAKMPGPHVVHMAYGIPFAIAPISPDPFWKIPLRYSFCRGGYMARTFEIPTQEEIRNVTIQMRSKTEGDPRTWNLQIQCRP